MGAELPFPILVSVIGVCLRVLLLLVHLGGGSRHRPLDETMVHALLADEGPTAELELQHVDPAGHHGLLRTVDGRRFVAWPMESSGALRQLPDTPGIGLDGEELVVRCSDPGWPARRLHLPAEQRAIWLQGAGYAA